jgi:hypothetical protein
VIERPGIVPLGFIDFIGELAEASNWLSAGTAGWKFLLCPSYRERTRDRWKSASIGRIARDVLLGLLGIVASLLGVAGILFGLTALFS